MAKATDAQAQALGIAVLTVSDTRGEEDDTSGRYLVEALRDAGRLVLAGPHPAIDSPDPGDAGFTGSLIVAEFDSLEQAQDWANLDPYLQHGVYQKVIVKPFNKVLP